MKTKPSLAKLTEDLLVAIGEEPTRQGLRRTPRRVEASLRALTAGYKADLRAVLNGAIFDEEYDEMVIIKDIDIYSLCEHHLLPFYGKCHVAYLPKGRIIGLSKIPRIVDIFARRLQVQERLTNQIANCLKEANIKTIADLVRKAESELLGFRNFGKKSLSEINDLLKVMGLHLGMKVDMKMVRKKE